MDFIQLMIKGIPYLGKANPKTLLLLGSTSVLATAASTKGGIDMQKSKAIRESAIKRWNDTISDLEEVEVETERVAREYGKFQISAHKSNVGRFADWLQKNQIKVKRLNFKVVDGTKVTIPDIPKYVIEVNSIATGASGLVGAVGVGVAAPAAALWGVSTFATAGTGAAISGLSGAAATSATLSSLGGGTLAAGGGGMAAGATVLGLTATVPMLLVGGFTLGVVGAKNKTASLKYESEINIEIERVLSSKDLLHQIQKRISELREVLEQISTQASEALSILESLDFDENKHASEFLRAFQLVTAVKEIVNTPILDPDTGAITEDSITITRKFA